MPAWRQGIELNCDLGEGEPPERTAAFMALVDSASVACGGHAGDEGSMRRCVELAVSSGARVGAHPGPPDRSNFGRSGSTSFTPDELADWLQAQIGALQHIAAGHGVRLHHVKLHGALYHATDRDPILRQAYVRTVAQHWPYIVVFARAGGATIKAARAEGLQAWEEGFLDRGYRDDGSLVPRGEAGALLEDAVQVTERLQHLVDRGGLRSVTGHWLELRARTVCVHGDTPHALEFLKVAREFLGSRRRV